MKHSILLLPLACSLLFSCSSDNASTNSQIIEKIISYIPQQSNFETKIVSYYDTENRNVLDSVFNANNSFIRKRQYSYSSHSKTISTYDNLNSLTIMAIEEFDGDGRLTNVTSYDASGNISFKYVYNYDDVNHSVAKNRVEGITVTPVFLFKLNAIGLIYYQEDIVNSNTQTELVFDGNLPLSMFISGNTANMIDFNYYPNMKPINLRISDVEKNNKVLRYGIEHMAFNADYYFSDYVDSYFVQYTFDTNGYPLTGHEFASPNNSLVEDFY